MNVLVFSGIIMKTETFNIVYHHRVINTERITVIAQLLTNVFIPTNTGCFTFYNGNGIHQFVFIGSMNDYIGSPFGIEFIVCKVRFKY